MSKKNGQDENFRPNGSTRAQISSLNSTPPRTRKRALEQHSTEEIPQNEKDVKKRKSENRTTISIANDEVGSIVFALANEFRKTKNLSWTIFIAYLLQPNLDLPEVVKLKLKNALSIEESNSMEFEKKKNMNKGRNNFISEYNHYSIKLMFMFVFELQLFQFILLYFSKVHILFQKFDQFPFFRFLL